MHIAQQGDSQVLTRRVRRRLRVVAVAVGAAIGVRLLVSLGVHVDIVMKAAGFRGTRQGSADS